jgi:phosphoribosylaminoimidazole-succinocarboxamide synthase
LDECRFTYESLHVSKEVARQYYKKTPWYEDVLEAKEKAEEKGIMDWKNLCRSKPQKLPANLKKIIADMYTSTANEFLGKSLFPSPKLKDVVKAYQNFS